MTKKSIWEDKSSIEIGGTQRRNPNMKWTNRLQLWAIQHGYEPTKDMIESLEEQKLQASERLEKYLSALPKDVLKFVNENIQILIIDTDDFDTSFATTLLNNPRAKQLLKDTHMPMSTKPYLVVILARQLNKFTMAHEIAHCLEMADKEIIANALAERWLNS